MQTNNELSQRIETVLSNAFATLAPQIVLDILTEHSFVIDNSVMMTELDEYLLSISENRSIELRACLKEIEETASKRKAELELEIKKESEAKPGLLVSVSRFLIKHVGEEKTDFGTVLAAIAKGVPSVLQCESSVLLFHIDQLEQQAQNSAPVDQVAWAKTFRDLGNCYDKTYLVCDD